MIINFRDYNILDVSGDKEECYMDCPELYAPVCGSDDQTYPSRCHLEAKACQVHNI